MRCLLYKLTYASYHKSDTFDALPIKKEGN